MKVAPLNIGEVLSKPAPEIDFVLHGLPIGAVGALVAPGSTGKTFLTLQIAAALALGVPVAGGALPPPDKRGITVLLTSEESRAMMARRLHALMDWLLTTNDYLPIEQRLERERMVSALAESVRIYPLAGRPVRIVEDGHVTKELGELVALCQGARLLILDPLRRFHTGDENSSADMTTLVQALESVTHRAKCAALITHHTNKASTLGGTGDLQQAVRGSSALTDAVRFQANLISMSIEEALRYGVSMDDRRYHVRLEVAKANYIAPVPTMWMRRMPGGCLQRVALREGRASRPSGKASRHG